MNEYGEAKIVTCAIDEYSFCRWVAKAAEEYFKDPKVRERFEKWKKEREAKEK